MRRYVIPAVNVLDWQVDASVTEVQKEVLQFSAGRMSRSETTSLRSASSKRKSIRTTSPSQTTRIGPLVKKEDD